jgi:hypothetical protein
MNTLIPLNRACYRPDDEDIRRTEETITGAKPSLPVEPIRLSEVTRVG